jgi:hypothetical protein
MGATSTVYCFGWDTRPNKFDMWAGAYVKKQRCNVTGQLRNTYQSWRILPRTQRLPLVVHFMP